jgi:hypothetical protein
MPSNIPQILSTGIPILMMEFWLMRVTPPQELLSLLTLDNPKALYFRIEKQEE